MMTLLVDSMFLCYPLMLGRGTGSGYCCRPLPNEFVWEMRMN